jgi:uncharacterized membrane protein YccC
MHALTTALPKQFTDWHEGRAAVRMLVAALAAYLCTAMIHLPGPYSAVITTLIVARPHSGGVLRASFERLTATILGAGVACVTTFGRLLHAPELLLIAIALAPLALIAAHNSAYRTSMIAAIIVLSAPATGGAPLYVAGIRMLGVSLGAVIGALVSVTILPSSREVVVARLTAKLLEQFADLLRNAIDPSARDAQTRDRFEYRVRQSLRELGLLIRDRPDALPTKGTAAAIVKFTVQMHADIAFLKRELQAHGPQADGPQTRSTRTIGPQANSPPTRDAPRPAPPSLEEFAQAFAATVTQVAAMARGRSAPPDIATLREKCGRATQSLSQEYSHSEGARLMLRRLVEDLAALIRSIAHARVGTTPDA